MMIVLPWLLYLFVIIPVLFFSTQIWRSPEDARAASLTKFNHSLLRHGEQTRDTASWVLRSGVCPLGRAWFYVYITVLLIFLLVYTFMPEAKFNQQVGYWQIVLLLFIIGTALGMLLNVPLLIRSIPALAASAVLVMMV
jgi:hypothetical protein